jgi:hypothetical protein
MIKTAFTRSRYFALAGKSFARCCCAGKTWNVKAAELTGLFGSVPALRTFGSRGLALWFLLRQGRKGSSSYQ